MKATRIRGASWAKSSENQGHFSTGSCRGGINSVSASTLERLATKATGIVQKIHSTAVEVKLINSPTCFAIFDLPTFFQLHNSLLVENIRAQKNDAGVRQGESEAEEIAAHYSLYKVWHRRFDWDANPRFVMEDGLAGKVGTSKVRKRNEGRTACCPILAADNNGLDDGGTHSR